MYRSLSNYFRVALSCKIIAGCPSTPKWSDLIRETLIETLIWSTSLNPEVWFSGKVLWTLERTGKVNSLQTVNDCKHFKSVCEYLSDSNKLLAIIQFTGRSAKVSLCFWRTATQLVATISRRSPGDLAVISHKILISWKVQLANCKVSWRTV